MVTEQSDGEQLSIDLPPDLEAWLAAEAEDHGLEQAELLERLLEVTRLSLVTDEGIEDIDEIEARVSTLEDELEPRVSTVEDDLDEKVQDVRRRVLQVKRETDAKAETDHSHAEFDRFDELEDRIDGVERALADLETSVAALESEVAESDEAFETVTDRLQRVASAVVRVQQATEGLDDDEQLEELKRTAARRGFEHAGCDACGKRVSLGLLTESRCPHCEADFADVTGRSGFFSTPTLIGRDEQ